MSIVNLENLIANSMGDEDFMKEIVVMTINQIKEQIGLLRGQCTDGPNEEWRLLAHSLKGSAATLGAEDMRLACQHAQMNMQDTDARARQTQVDIIADHYEEIRQELVKLGYME